MNYYKYKCSSCGSTQYEKIGNSLKCKYCGNTQDIFIEPKIEKNETTTSVSQQIVEKPKQETVAKESITNKILDRKLGSVIIRLVACLLGGIFGIHKFLEGKFKWGVIYFVTLGLCGVGVVYDIVCYIIKIVEISKERMN